MMDQIKRVRKSMNVSQYALAKVAGVSRFKISLAESGYVDLNQDERRKVMAALKQLEHRKAATK